MLHLHRAERADRLVAGLADVLREPLADPFAAEVIAVSARGVERWLTQRLAHCLGASDGGMDGVCANVHFPSPAALVGDAVARASGTVPAEDPWQPRRIVWPLLEVLTECAEEPWCSALGGVAARGRLLSAAQHLAELFEYYGASRPAMLRAWVEGAWVEGQDADGAGGRLDADLRWQAEVWRRLRTRIGVPSPAERLNAACAAISERPELLELPGRLSLFGPTRLTTDQLSVLQALAQRRDVHLWLPHPSPALWDRVKRRSSAAGGLGDRPRRRADPTAEHPQHPLLSSLGRDARELQLLLAAGGAEVVDQHLTQEVGPAEFPPTLLGRVQMNLRDDFRPDERPQEDRPLFDSADRSVQVHACHGPARQVEVLREVLLGLLAADSTLEPRDVLVMCPDIEAFAPLISAGFGSGEPAGRHHPAHLLRVRLADRALRQTNPLLGTLALLLELADARVTASEVLDLAASAPVRRRFSFDDDELDRIRDWVGRAGIRWGLDAAHRTPFRLAGIGQNTWKAGLDRILLGAAMSEDDQRWLGLALPLDDVDSGDIDLAGRLAELVERLGTALTELTGERSLASWLGSLADALDALTAVSERDGWQLTQARRELADVAEEAGGRAGQVRLTLADVRALMAGRLRGRPTRANFRTGSLTMCSMVPMRSVPHRVICLLGLDDGVFPRNAVVDGDDVLARDPCVGERNRRSEERQLLLDAVLAAQEHLVILYTGADDRTNAVRLPAVPVGEILDALEATVRAAPGRSVREQLVVHHPLQPFDERNFTDGSLGSAGPFSFDRPSLAGARAATGLRRMPMAFLPEPLPEYPPEPLPGARLGAPGGSGLELADLLRFLDHPVRGFLRQRLGVTVLGEDDEVTDALAAELGHLQSWAVGDRLLTARLAGADASSCRQAEWRRGTLPAGPLGAAVLDRLLREIEPLLAAAAEARIGEVDALDVALELPGQRRLNGTVSGIYNRTLVRVVYSRLGPKHRLRAWAQLLALSASRGEQPWRAVTIGRGRGRSTLRATLIAPPAEVAIRILADLIDLYDRGMREPLPLAVKASEYYAGARATGGPQEVALAAAASAWNPNRGMGEAEDRHHELVWGPAPDLALLLQQSPRPQEIGPGWPAEPHRFGALACRLWEPLLAAETLDVP